MVDIRHDQRLAFANHPSGDAVRGGKTDPAQPLLVADAAIVGDFEVQFVAFFIEQDDGGALDVEQRHHALDGEFQQMVEIVDGGERLDMGPLLEARHRLDGVCRRGGGRAGLRRLREGPQGQEHRRAQLRVGEGRLQIAVGRAHLGIRGQPRPFDALEVEPGQGLVGRGGAGPLRPLAGPRRPPRGRAAVGAPRANGGRVPQGPGAPAVPRRGRVATLPPWSRASAARLTAIGRRQLQLAPILRHRPARDLDLLRRQHLDELLIGEGFCRILCRHQLFDAIFDRQRRPSSRRRRTRGRSGRMTSARRSRAPSPGICW